MIIAQMPGANIATITSPTGTGTFQAFQYSSLAVTNGFTAGNVMLPLGQGFAFGLPFHVILAGSIKSLGTAQTYNFGLTPFVTSPVGAGAVFTTAQEVAAATPSLTTGATYPFYFDFELFIEANSQTLSGASTGATGLGASISALTRFGPFTAEPTTAATAFNLPSVAAPYSWPAKITGLDTAINNAPFLYLVPKVAANTGTAVGTIVTLETMVVTQG